MNQDKDVKKAFKDRANSGGFDPLIKRNQSL
jgi:hypothetical protein